MIRLIVTTIFYWLILIPGGNVTAAGRAEAAQSLPAPHRADQAATSVRVMTLNVGHGRGESFNQMFLSRREILANLERIGSTLRRESVQLAALQEIDAPSWWSGGFAQLDAVTRQAGLPWVFHGIHSKGPRFGFGTALISSIPLRATESVSFDRTFPTLTKGFVKATFDWPETGVKRGEERRVTMVSAHLDFASVKKRERQIATLYQKLRDDPNALVVAGDFNDPWADSGSTLAAFASDLGLKSFWGEADQMVTFRRLGTRLDWILVSDELEFANYRTLKDPLSDHLAVVADIRWAK
jgi:endonuclease/exonuclease/phosphatase family metal-dependent hydrolase